MSAHTPGPLNVIVNGMRVGTVNHSPRGYRYMPMYQAQPSRKDWPTPEAALAGRVSNYSLEPVTPKEPRDEIIAELLEACRKVHACGNGGARLSRAASDAVRAAIAKAEGKQ